MKRWIGCLGILLIIIGAASYGLYRYYKGSKKVGWVTEEVDRGDIRQVISATGSLSALKTVEVGCQISGIVASISVDFNDRVTAGQLIAQIDPSTHEAQVQQATANLMQSRSSERNLIAQRQNLLASQQTAAADRDVSRANARKAKVALEDAQRNLKRISELYQRKLVAQSDLDSAQTAVDSAAAALEAAEAQVKATISKEEAVKAQIEAITAQHEGALAQIEQMTAQLNVAKINLERTRIYSPVDGVVISRNVDVGQTVAASLQAPTLFTIAEDLRKMQINTAVDEADIGKVREGQKVFFTVDAYRGREFVGTVDQVRLSPTVTSNVVTYAVMVNVENTDLALKPGMTASVEILVEEKKNVLRIPARAQFFRIPDEYRAQVASDTPLEEKPDVTRIWVLNHRRPEPREVVIGLSTSQLAEVVGGNLGVGEQVIIDTRKPGDTSSNNGSSSSMRSGMRDYRRMSRGR